MIRLIVRRASQKKNSGGPHRPPARATVKRPPPCPSPLIVVWSLERVSEMNHGPPHPNPARPGLTAIYERYHQSTKEDTVNVYKICHDVELSLIFGPSVSDTNCFGYRSINFIFTYAQNFGFHRSVKRV